MTPLGLAVVGASGKMGRAVVRLAAAHGFRVVRAVAPSHAGRDAGALAGEAASGVRVEADASCLASGGFDVVIDFSTPAATRTIADIAAGAAIVSGTTGLDAEVQEALARASARAAVFWEPNMSLGIHVLSDLVRRAAIQLGEDFDAEVFEAHHRRKVDAPSGTAARLVEELQLARTGSTGVVFGRSGRVGPRPSGEIGVHALRGGDVLGDHTVHFLGLGERLELTHRATDRDVFARGALRAAAFVAGRPPGRYGMSDLVASDAAPARSRREA